MRFKVPPDYIGLCGSCRNGSLAKTVNGHVFARCDWFNADVMEPIESCSKYDDLRLPSLYDMRCTAWILRTDDKRNVIGFVSNQQWRKSKEFRDNPSWGDEDD